MDQLEQCSESECRRGWCTIQEQSVVRGRILIALCTDFNGLPHQNPLNYYVHFRSSWPRRTIPYSFSRRCLREIRTLKTCLCFRWNPEAIKPSPHPLNFCFQKPQIPFLIQPTIYSTCGNFVDRDPKQYCACRPIAVSLPSDIRATCPCFSGLSLHLLIFWGTLQPPNPFSCGFFHFVRSMSAANRQFVFYTRQMNSRPPQPIIRQRIDSLSLTTVHRLLTLPLPFDKQQIRLLR